MAKGHNSKFTQIDIPRIIRSFLSRETIKKLKRNQVMNLAADILMVLLIAAYWILGKGTYILNFASFLIAVVFIVWCVKTNL